MLMMSAPAPPWAVGVAAYTMPLRTQENAPLPQCNTFTPMIVALGAMPTVPELFAGAATMPATCVPCQKVSLSTH